MTVEDDGRGIPVDMHKEEGRSAAEVIMTELHSGGKFDKNSYKVSGGLHGVGVSVVNALSETPGARGQARRQGLVPDLPPRRPRRADQADRHEREDAAPRSASGRTPRSSPILEFHYDTLATRLREQSFLNRGIHIHLNDERTDKEADFAYAGGISSFVEHLNRNKTAAPRSRSTSSTCATTAPARRRSRSPCSGTTATRS